MADQPWEVGDDAQRWAGYLNPATGLLLVVGDRQPATAADLSAFEASRVENRAVDLREDGIAGSFDLAHVQAIHHQLFQDVYPWAGQIRTVNISKGMRTLGDGTEAPAGFLPYQHVPYVVEGMAAELRSENYLRGLGNDDFADRLAYHFNTLNEAHPFREGNGRTQRIFWDQLAEQAGHHVLWGALTRDANVQLSHQARTSDNIEPMRQAFRLLVVDDSEQSRRMKAAEAAWIATGGHIPPTQNMSRQSSASYGSNVYRPGRDLGRGYGAGR